MAVHQYPSYHVASVRPYGVCTYTITEWPPKRKLEQLGIPEAKAPPKHQKYTGVLTEFTRRKMTKAIQLLIAIAQPKQVINPSNGKSFTFKINFITLTLSKVGHGMTDKEVKQKLLDPWLKRMKRKYHLKNYVWRAERQKNGNIHFHFLTDCFIRYDHIRNDWNALQYRYGFLDNYYLVHGHHNANSTDVHSVRKVKHLAQYITKYMSKKGGEKDKIEGKVWDCSENLKAKIKCEVLIDKGIEDELKDLVSDKRIDLKVRDMFQVLLVPPSLFDQKIKGRLRQSWDDYLCEVANFQAS